MNDLIKWSHWEIESSIHPMRSFCNFFSFLSVRSSCLRVWERWESKEFHIECKGNVKHFVKGDWELWNFFGNISNIKNSSAFTSFPFWSSSEIYMQSVKHWNFYASNIYNRTLSSLSFAFLLVPFRLLLNFFSRFLRSFVFSQVSVGYWHGARSTRQKSP